MTQFKSTTIPSSSGGTITFTKTGLIHLSNRKPSIEPVDPSAPRGRGRPRKSVV